VKLARMPLGSILTANLSSNFMGPRSRAMEVCLPNITMDAFFKVPAIVFDLGTYSRCLGLSENSFRLYIYECACVNKTYLGHRAGSRAAKHYLGLDEQEYLAAKRDLASIFLSLFSAFMRSKTRSLKIFSKISIFSLFIMTDVIYLL